MRVSGINVVVVSAESLAELSAAYSSYFVIHGAFVRVLKSLFGTDG
jgi:hypothetical protein